MVTVRLALNASLMTATESADNVSSARTQNALGNASASSVKVVSATAYARAGSVSRMSAKGIALVRSVLRNSYRRYKPVVSKTGRTPLMRDSGINLNLYVFSNT